MSATSKMALIVMAFVGYVCNVSHSRQGISWRAGELPTNALRSLASHKGAGWQRRNADLLSHCPPGDRLPPWYAESRSDGRDRKKGGRKQTLLRSFSCIVGQLVK
jgi:hypothetical protein